LHPPFTEYDILRALPFGGAILEADMKGSLLIEVLNAGKKNIGNGGFLQYSSFVSTDAAGNTWTIHNMPIDTSKIYRVAIGEFLLSGKEVNLDFLNSKNPEIIQIYDPPVAANDPRADIRLSIVQYLIQRNGQL